MDNDDRDYVRALLVELLNIYATEGGGFLPGIAAAIDSIDNASDAEGRGAGTIESIYPNMAGSKSGFSDFYVERNDLSERVKANDRRGLYSARELWRILAGS
ncbi:hypothetical protein ACU4GD_37930 [Cupriavidus basilensis]